MNSALHPIVVFVQTWWTELVCGVVILAAFPLVVAYVLLIERKILADKQVVPGPSPVGLHGLLPSLADGLKLLVKEEIVPDNADKFIFWLAPILSLVAALASMGAIAFGPALQVARDINVGILFVIAVASLGFLGVLLGDWASNGHSNIGAVRSTAVLVSFGVAGGLAVVSALLLSGTLNIRGIVEAQQRSGAWFIFLGPIAFLIYLIASIAQTNRVPFDLPGGGSELDAGRTIEHRGFRWSLYFLAEHAKRIVVASVATTLFLGGWLRPFPNVPWLYWLDYLPPILIVLVAVCCIYRTGKQSVLAQSLWMWVLALVCLCVAAVFAIPVVVTPLQSLLPGLHGAFWFLLKVGILLYIFAWLRLTIPRYGFGQLMRVSWYILIPVAIVNIFAIGTALFLEYEAGWSRWSALGVMTLFPLALTAYLMRLHEKRGAGASSAAVMATDSYAG
jgi:NADH-quinone oxidoreductase subunit H